MNLPLKPPRPPLTTLLKSCKTLHCFQQIHVHIILKGLHQHNYLISRFISLFNTTINNNNNTYLSYISSVFNSVIYPNTCLFNSLIQIYSQHSSLYSTLSLFSYMRIATPFVVVPDKYTFPPVIRVCSDDFSVWNGMGIHGLVVKYGVVDDLYVGSSLVDFYGKCRLMGYAHKVFDEMSERNVVTWTCLLSGFVSLGDLGCARRVFDVMPKRNRVSWNVMISGYVKFGEVCNARKLFDEMPCRNVVSYTTMIEGYAKRGDMGSARCLFDHCEDKDVVMWSSLISGYAQNGLPNEAVKCFFDMERHNVRIDEFVMVSVMSACAQLANLELAKWIDSYMMKNHFDCNRVHVAAALVDMNVKCGNIDRAMNLFNGMSKRDLVSYCSMIQGLSIHGQGTDPAKLFHNMISEGITPDGVAFTVILTACSRAGLVEEGCCLFDMMRNRYCISPSPDHYACMIDLLGRFGHLKPAYDLLKSVPFKLHAGAWGALLGACRLHNDSALAEVVANQLVELEPQNAGNYVLLSNIYAAADRWLDVCMLRDQMADRGIRKIPGQSCVLGFGST